MECSETTPRMRFRNSLPGLVASATSPSPQNHGCHGHVAWPMHPMHPMQQSLPPLLIIARAAGAIGPSIRAAGGCRRRESTRWSVGARGGRRRGRGGGSGIAGAASARRGSAGARRPTRRGWRRVAISGRRRRVGGIRIAIARGSRVIGCRRTRRTRGAGSGLSVARCRVARVGRSAGGPGRRTVA